MGLDRARVLERADDEAHGIVDWLMEAIRGAPAEEGGPPAAEDAADEIDLDTAWTAVRALHRELDQQLEEGGSPASVLEMRRRLAGASKRLARSFQDSEMRAYREMLRDISHDIRTPLNSIIFLTDGLFSGQSGPLNSTQERQLGIIYSAATSLLNFVNDILDFARTGDGRRDGVAEVPFSLQGVSSDVKRLVEPLVVHNDTDFQVAIDAAGARRGDPQLLCRVLVNLVSNAVEATGDGGRVHVVIGEVEGDRETLEILVEDDGFGPDIERIRQFLRPRRERELTRMLQGRTHGLGLHICSRLVRSAGGRISVEARNGGGTRFEVRLPFQRE